MNKMNFILLLAVVAGLWLAAFSARYFVAWLRLLRLRFIPGGAVRVGRDALPADVALLLDPMVARLATLGFGYRESLRIEAQLRGASRAEQWADVYFNAASGSWALVQLAEVPEPGALVNVSLLNNFGDRLLATENRRLHLYQPMPPSYDAIDAGVTCLADQWACHRRRLDDAKGVTVTDADAFHALRSGLRAAVFEYGQRLGSMRRIGDEWAFTAKGAWSYLRQVAAGDRRIASLPPMVDVEPLELRCLADANAWQNQEALLDNHAMSRRSKVLWFLASAVAGIAAFGYMVSWPMVPVVVAVLLFHEFGHALAMRAVGYRGLGVLMLPFLGAVAIGRKDDAGPWQKLAVLLAGPLPGLLLAVIALRLAMPGPDEHRLLLSIGIMALVINYFNLLPFSPLDGGQIVDNFLFAHRPRLRFAFLAASAMALVAVGLAVDSVAFAALGFIFSLALPAVWRRTRLLVGIPYHAGDDAVRAILTRLHESPGPRWPAFAQRMQILRTLLPSLRGRSPRLVETLAGLAIYGAVIALPVVGLWSTGLPQQAYAQVVGQTTASDDDDYD